MSHMAAEGWTTNGERSEGGLELGANGSKEATGVWEKVNNSHTGSIHRLIETALLDGSVWSSDQKLQ